MFIDTHTHLESFARKGELEATLERARQAGLEALVTIGTEPEDWRLYRKLAEQKSGFIHYTAGLHPCSVEERWSEALAELEPFWESEQPPVALGETGLDRFHLPQDPQEAERLFGWQRAAFAAQLALARRLNCPVVVHSRGAFEDCVRMVDASGVPWEKVVFHCFTDGPAQVEQLRQRGGYGSFTGILTYKTAEAVRQAALTQGLERLMLETDAPYLTPMPHRGKANEPAFLRFTAEYAARLFEVSLETLALKSSALARAFYRLP